MPQQLQQDHGRRRQTAGLIAAFSSDLDASSYGGIGFWAQGAGQTLGIGLHTGETKEAFSSGFVLDAENTDAGLALTGSWTYYEVMFDDLVSIGTVPTINSSRINEIQFIVGPNADVWIDDVSLIAP